LRIRDSKHLRIHIVKVKTHTYLEYNELADVTAIAVVNGEAPPDITFIEADPPIGGLRTWPQIRKTAPNKTDSIHKITNLKTDIKRVIKANKDNRTKGIFGRLL
jgi:hypothetical protein